MLCSRVWIRCFSAIIRIATGFVIVRVVCSLRTAGLIYAVHIFQTQSVGTCGGSRVQTNIFVGTEADTQACDVGSGKILCRICPFALGGKIEVSQAADVDYPSVNNFCFNNVLKSFNTLKASPSLTPEVRPISWAISSKVLGLLYWYVICG